MWGRGEGAEIGDQDREYTFRVSEGAAGVGTKGLMADCGVTSYIITDLAKFQRFDDWFQDGTRCKGIAERWGDAEVCLIDSKGRALNATLKQALYVPSYPQDILFLKSTNQSTQSREMGIDMHFHLLMIFPVQCLCIS